MVLRRVRSAPASLAGSTQRDAGLSRGFALIDPGVVVSDIDDKVVQKGALTEIVSVVADDVQRTDPTEELFFYLLFRWIFLERMERWQLQLSTALLRLVTSFVTHQFIAWAVHVLHENGGTQILQNMGIVVS